MSNIIHILDNLIFTSKDENHGLIWNIHVTFLRLAVSVSAAAAPLVNY